MEAVAIISGLLLAIAILFFPFIPEFAQETWTKFRNHRRKKTEKNLPLYERLARAEEREADRYIDMGRTKKAREHFREAQKIRREATDAMMRGEEPTL